MKIDSLHRLYVHLLKDIYNAEHQMTRALPKMIKAAQHPDLKRAFETHLKETGVHVERIEKIFAGMDFKPGGEHCPAMEGLVVEAESVMKETADSPSVADAALVIAAQKIEHYEIANYGSACSLANALGEKKAAALLHQTLWEEKHADGLLAHIARHAVNAAAQTISA